MRRFLAAVTAVGLAVGAAGCGGPADDNRLVVGMDPSYPPFEMLDKDGRPAGISADIAQALGQHLGREVVIRTMPFAGLIPALRTGRIDVVISSMTVTPERAQTVAFSEPYVRTGLSLLAGKDAPVQSAADLAAPGRRAVVRLGSTGQIYADAHLKPENVLVVDRVEGAVMEVQQGRADAFIVDPMSAWRFAGLHPDTTRAILAPFQVENWAMALRPGDTELLGQVNAFIRDYRAQGGFDRLGDRYLGDLKKAFAEQGVPFVF